VRSAPRGAPLAATRRPAPRHPARPLMPCRSYTDRLSSACTKRRPQQTVRLGPSQLRHLHRSDCPVARTRARLRSDLRPQAELQRHPGQAITRVAAFERDWEPPRPRSGHDQIVGLRVAFAEVAVRDRVKQAGGMWNPERRVWQLRYDRVTAVGLNSRIVDEPASN